jgi:Na+/melibiose symporter-like transporter
MNLALAAGIALPALAMLGYVPQGKNSAESLTYLAAIYALLPCVLKAIAAAALLYSPFVRSAAKTGGAIPLAKQANP